MAGFPERMVAHHLRYKGLFTPRMAPTKRAHCILFSFFFGVLELTTGSVFLHVITSRPTSGGHLLHTPPLPLAVGLVVVGVVTIMSAFWVAIRHGFDDGDESLEEYSVNIAKEDVLDQQYQMPAADVPNPEPPSAQYLEPCPNSSDPRVKTQANNITLPQRGKNSSIHNSIRPSDIISPSQGYQFSSKKQSVSPV